MIPACFAPILFGFILLGLMSCIVSGIAMFRALSDEQALVDAWMAS